MTTSTHRTTAREREAAAAAGVETRGRRWSCGSCIFMALAFGAGIAVMVMYEEPQTVVGVQQPVGQFPQAPPLTDEQIQGGLPTGHPDLSGGTGATGAVDAEQASGSGRGDGATGSG
jgi:hypothetical protein